MCTSLRFKKKPTRQVSRIRRREYLLDHLKIVRCDATIDDEPCACCPGGLVGGQVERHVDDVVGLAEATEWDAVQAQVTGFFAGPQDTQQGCFDGTWTDGVAAHAMTAILYCERFGEREHAAFGDGISVL